MDSVWDPYGDEEKYEEAVQLMFFSELAPRLLASTNLKFDQKILQRAWNLQVDSQVRARVGNRRKPYSLSQQFYVYVLMDPRIPGPFKYNFLGKEFMFSHQVFYVGKGKNDRVKDHLWMSRKSGPVKGDHKGNKIRKLESLGLKPLERIISQKTIESVAMVKEMLLIKTIGRADRGLGTLTNRTDGGDGASGLIVSEKNREAVRRRFTGRTYRHTEETKEKLRQARLGGPPPKHTKEGLEKLRRSALGRIHTDEQRRKNSEAQKGRHTGSKNLQAKLTEPDVVRIKKMLEAGFTGVQIANEYKVTTATISGIRVGKTWTHVRI
jgi:hypothetical protein